MLRRRAVALALLSAALFPGSIQGSQQPQFRSRTLAVRVDVLVTDGRKPVVGLSAGDFELRDNDIIQTVQVVDAAEVPLNVAAGGLISSPQARRCSTGSNPLIAQH